MIVFYELNCVPMETEVIVDQHKRMHICKRKIDQRTKQDIMDLNPIFFNPIRGYYICEGCRYVLTGELLTAMIGWEDRKNEFTN